MCTTKMNTIKISCHLLYSVQALFMEMQKKKNLNVRTEI